jgi:hypothetical protein
MSAERPLYSYRHALEVFVGLEAFCFRFRAGFVISAYYGVSASEDWIALGHGCGMWHATVSFTMIPVLDGRLCVSDYLDISLDY